MLNIGTFSDQNTIFTRLEHYSNYQQKEKNKRFWLKIKSSSGLVTNVCIVVLFSFKDSKRFSLLRLTDAVIQLEREIMQQKEKLNSSSTELRIMIRWYIILVSIQRQ